MIVRPTADGVVALAPAKLNLFLEVLGKRADGYHDLESLMVTVNLHDTLTFADDPSGRITLTCDDPSLPTGPENLVVKAAEGLRRRMGVERGATIHLSKAIPSQAGLAGGSSDAAATLSALDRLWNLSTPPGVIDALAGEIGSDVAFFRHAPAAVCRGRGERVEPIATSRALHFVVVCPPVGLSTADVYGNLDLPDRPRPIEPILEAFSRGEISTLGTLLFNRLQGVAERLEPGVVAIRDALRQLGSPTLDGSLMSGSGSAYFGLARDRDAAEVAALHLTTLGLGRVRVVSCGP